MTDHRCIDCSRFDLKSAGDMARLGFGVCSAKSMTKGHTFSAMRPHACDRFSSAPQEVAAKRLAWLEKKGSI